MVSSIVGRANEVPGFQIRTVEGLPVRGWVAAKKLLHGENALLVEIQISRGTVIPVHRHRHESYLYVVSGRVRAAVGDAIFVLEPMDAVLHPAGVDHSSEAIEDSVWIEVKTPAEETWHR